VVAVPLERYNFFYLHNNTQNKRALTHDYIPLNNETYKSTTLQFVANF
jgi:hypothetical protein